MANVNLFIGLGNLTRDPVVKQLQNGSSVCEFGIAINETWKTKDGEKRESVLYIDCSAWGKLGEIIEKYLRKGDPIHVVGKLKLDQWEDKTSGGKRSKISLIVNDMQMLGSKKSGGEGGDEQPAANQPEAGPAINDADIPF